VESRVSRRLYIDWLRGVAVLLMILWHTIDSWTVQTGRNTAAFAAIVFAAGWAAPLFLFLAGVAIPLGIDTRQRRGFSRREASWDLQKRGWMIVVLAHLFRFQSFLLNPHGSWNTLLKPDILNVLGLGIVAGAFAWGRAETRRTQTMWLLGTAAVIVVVLTPWSRVWWWPTLLHPRLEAYIRPVGTYGVFTLFPALAYIFVGVFLGGRIAETRPDDTRFQKSMAFAGAVLIALSVAGRPLPRPATITLAESVPAVLWCIGVMTLALPASWLIVRRRSPDAWSPLVLFGQTSLFVYWVHVELAYGVFSYPLRHALELPWSFAAYVLFTTFMLGCATLWQRRPRGPLIPQHMVAWEHPEPLRPRSSV